MPLPVRLTVGDVVLQGELSDSPLARQVADALPLESTLRTFGDSFYIETPMAGVLGPDASDAVSVGDLAYWPAALAVAVFFGPTPESLPGSAEPVAASDVEVIGHVEGADRLAGAPRAGVMSLALA